MESRAEFGQFVQKYFCKGVGAEIGVYRGENAAMILASWKGKIILVDAWRPLPGFEFTWSENSEEDHQRNYRMAQENLAIYEDRCQWMRCTSAEAAMRIEDGSLDWVYIDTNHKYEYVAQDLRLWYPKVRVGGIVSGHDYVDPNREGGLGRASTKPKWFFGVKPAVDDLVEIVGAKLHVTTKDLYETWWFEKTQ